ncbi:MAG TPA: glycoside hydrolase family 88 protein [Polyangiales bacterium]|nr:glycoside hydrolase family 88 protein [Polyangiales bacterium]
MTGVVLVSYGCDSNGDDDQSNASAAVKDASPDEPLVTSQLGVAAADYLIARWPELDYTPDDCTGPSNCFSMNFASVPAGAAPKFWEYTYGVPLFGIQTLYEKTGDTRYRDFVRKYVDRYVDADGEISRARSWPANPDGTQPAPNDPTIQDVIQPSILLFGLHKQTKEDKYLRAMTRTRGVFDDISRNPDGAFWHKPTYPNQQWLDGIYMSEPFLVRYGATYAGKDAATCYDLATEQIKLAAEHTFDPPTKLYFHAWNGAEDGAWLGLALPSKVPPKTGQRVSPILWARSLAWFFAGTVDVLEYLPRDHADRPALLEIVRNIAGGLERLQDEQTGLFYQVLDVRNGSLPERGGYLQESDRPAQPNWLETSSSALFAYAYAKAVRLGVLDTKYLAIAKRAYAGVQSKVELGEDGAVTIRGTVVGMSVGGVYNAYVNADFREDLESGPPPAPTTCPTASQLGADRTPPLDCKYIYVRDNVPQGFGALLLAASELEF